MGVDVAENKKKGAGFEKGNGCESFYLTHQGY